MLGVGLDTPLLLWRWSYGRGSISADAPAGNRFHCSVGLWTEEAARTGQGTGRWHPGIQRRNEGACAGESCGLQIGKEFLADSDLAETPGVDRRPVVASKNTARHRDGAPSFSATATERD